MMLEHLTLEPIGVISTPFSERYRAPRQPGANEPVEGVITLAPNKNFEQALHDLNGFERIWLIYWFHRNKNWKPKVLPPRGTKTKRGLFATRSPHRPNPLGLSLVTLIEVKGRSLRVSGVDLLDGTPILDIKPYLPFVEAHPKSRCGWLEENLRADARTAVVWLPLAELQTAYLLENFNIDLRTHAGRVLSADPGPHPYRRIREMGNLRVLAIQSWRVFFELRGDCVRIERIASGYAPARLQKEEGKPIHQRNAHIAFQSLWPT